MINGLITVLLSSGEQVFAKNGDYLVMIFEDGKCRYDKVFANLQEVTKYIEGMNLEDVKIFQLVNNSMECVPIFWKKSES